MAVQAGAYQAYRNTQIQTASSSELLLMLYDGAIKFCKQALVHLEDCNWEAVHNSLTKVQDIIAELSMSLNFAAGGEIATSLHQLYDYMERRLIEANVQKKAEPVQEVLGMLNELRDAWAEAARKIRKEKAMSTVKGVNISK